MNTRHAFITGKYQSNTSSNENLYDLHFIDGVCPAVSVSVITSSFQIIYNNLPFKLKNNK